MHQPIQPALLATVFASYPYGILIVSAQRHIVAHNAAARAILGDEAQRLDAPAPVDACALLGCRVPAGPLEHVCLFECASLTAEPLPEVRLDLPGEISAWVTAARIDADDARYVVELRPAQRNDRRRRTDPHWTRGRELRLLTLGRTRVQSAEGPIDGDWLGNRAGQMLKYLAAARHRAVFADEIAEHLWPDGGTRSLQSVRYFVHVLRDQLEPGRARRTPSSFVASTRGGYQLDLMHVSVDADDFERHVGLGLAAHRADRLADAAAELTAAMALYGGDFLADEPYAEWAIAERDRLRELAADALRTLADIRLAQDDLAACAASLERLTELEPYDVDVHRRLIDVCLRRGRRSEAMRRYAVLRQRMLSTFGEDLDFALADLRSPVANG